MVGTLWYLNIANWKIHSKWRFYWENHLFLWSIFQLAMLKDPGIMVLVLSYNYHINTNAICHMWPWINTYNVRPPRYLSGL